MKRPQLQFSLPVKGILDANRGLPRYVEPVLGLGLEKTMPTRFHLTVLNCWVEGEGTWQFIFKMVQPDGTAPFDLWAENKHTFEEDEYGTVPFMDYVRCAPLVKQAGRYWFVVECGGQEVLRYPVWIGPIEGQPGLKEPPRRPRGRR